MSEMIERVARALCIRKYTGVEDMTWDNLDRRSRDLFMDAARAAIESMFEPTDLMKELGERVVGAELVWKVMLETSLRSVDT